MNIQSSNKSISINSGESYLASTSVESHSLRFETRTDSITESLKVLQQAVKALELFQQVYGSPVQCESTDKSDKDSS